MQLHRFKRIGIGICHANIFEHISYFTQDLQTWYPAREIWKSVSPQSILGKSRHFTWRGTSLPPQVRCATCRNINRFNRVFLLEKLIRAISFSVKFSFTKPLCGFHQPSITFHSWERKEPKGSRFSDILLHRKWKLLHFAKFFNV